MVASLASPPSLCHGFISKTCIKFCLLETFGIFWGNAFCTMMILGACCLRMRIKKALKRSLNLSPEACSSHGSSIEQCQTPQLLGYHSGLHYLVDWGLSSSTGITPGFLSLLNDFKFWQLDWFQLFRIGLRLAISRTTTDPTSRCLLPPSCWPWEGELKPVSNACVHYAYMGWYDVFARCGIKSCQQPGSRKANDHSPFGCFTNLWFYDQLRTLTQGQVP